MENFLDHSYDKKAYRANIFSGGAGLGAVLALPFYVLWFLNNPDISLGGYAVFVQFATFVAVFLYIGTKAAKIYSPNNTVAFSYGRAYGHAILMSIISGAVSAILMWLLYSVISPEFGDAVMNHAFDTQALVLQEQGLSSDQIQEGMAWGKQFYGWMQKIYISLPVAIFTNTFTGALTALITSLLVKKDIKRF